MLWKNITTNLRSQTSSVYALDALTIFRGPSRSGKSRVIDSVRLLLSGGVSGLTTAASVAEFTSASSSLSVRLDADDPSHVTSLDAKVGSAIPPIYRGAALLERYGDADLLPHSNYAEILSFGPEKLRRVLNAVFGPQSDDHHFVPQALSEEQIALWEEAAATVREQKTDLSFLDAMAKTLDSMARQSSQAASIFASQIENIGDRAQEEIGDHEPIDALLKRKALAEAHLRWVYAKNNLDSYPLVEPPSARLIADVEEVEAQVKAGLARRDEMHRQLAELEAAFAREQHKVDAIRREQGERKHRIECVLTAIDMAEDSCPVCGHAVGDQLPQMKAVWETAADGLTKIPNPDASEINTLRESIRELSTAITYCETRLADGRRRIEEEQATHDRWLTSINDLRKRIDSAPDDVRNYDGPSVEEINAAIAAHQRAEATRRQGDAVEAQKARAERRNENAKTLKQVAQEASVQQSKTAITSAENAINYFLPVFMRVDFETTKSKFRIRVRFVGEKKPRSIHTLCGTEFALLRTALCLAFAFAGREKIPAVVLDDTELAMMDRTHGQWTLAMLEGLIHDGRLEHAFIAWPASWTWAPSTGLVHDFGDAR